MTSKQINISKKLVEKLNLDLRGLTVITECASGDYMYTPIIAALAGAQVIALGRDTSYGTYKENFFNLHDCVEKLPELNIEIHEYKEFNQWYRGDIITNSGQLRPIDRSIIGQLKRTAVIPLMWETWEFRESDLDIGACQKNDITVIGTNEGYEAANMYAYPGLMALKILFDLKAEVANSRLALFGGGLTGKLVAKTFNDLGVKFDWFTASGSEQPQDCYSYEEIESVILEQRHFEAIVFAEHTDKRKLIGDEGFISWNLLSNRYPDLAVAHICGNVDSYELQQSGLQYLPAQPAPFGHMSFLPDVLSPYPVLLLNAAGLKVGELGARARLQNKTIEEAIDIAVSHGIGQDFEGGFLNYGRD